MSDQPNPLRHADLVGKDALDPQDRASLKKHQSKWLSLPVAIDTTDRLTEAGGAVTLKLMRAGQQPGTTQRFSKANVRAAIRVIQEARTALHLANQAVSRKTEDWSAAAKALAAAYFKVNADMPAENHAQRIRAVVSAAQTGLAGTLSLKLTTDGGGARGSVPQETRDGLMKKPIRTAVEAELANKGSPPTEKEVSEAVEARWNDLGEQGRSEFLAANPLQVRPQWQFFPVQSKDVPHPKDLWAHGIRMNQTFIGEAEKMVSRPVEGGRKGRTTSEPTYPEADLILRAKTLVHEATHRFANTQDHAYFEDVPGGDLRRLDYVVTVDVPRTGKQPPANEKVDDWLDNADGYGWFCVRLALLT